MRKLPPRLESRSEAKMVGESNLGKHMKSIDPDMLTSAVVVKSPMIP